MVSTAAADTGVGTLRSRPLSTTSPFMKSISVGRPLVTSWAIDARQFRLEPSAGVSIVSSATHVSRQPARPLVALVGASNLGRLVEVIDGGARLERLVGPGDRDPALTDRLDLLGPRIDQRHVVTRAREKRAQVAADRARADEENLLAHSVPFSASRR